MNTGDLIKKDKCYCVKKKTAINLADCEMFNGCNKEKSCTKKSVQNYK